MERYISAVKDEIDNEQAVFVFPSEITAHFWRKQALLITGKQAVKARRFISWDKFKEQVFSLSFEERPVNNAMRHMFAASFLHRNSQDPPLLRYLIHPEFARNSLRFSKSIISILPRLYQLWETERESGYRLEPDLRNDLEKLYQAYQGFLKKNSLFEPSWMEPGMNSLENHYFLFFSEVIEDFREFSSLLLEQSNIRVLSLDAQGLPPLTRFPNSRLEIQWLLNRVCDLLDQGVAYEDIVLTIADLNSLEPLLTREAALRNLPLDIRKGKSLAEYPVAQLLYAIRDYNNSGQSVTALKRVVLNNAGCFLEKERFKELVAFGIKHHCARNYRIGGKSVAVWESRLKQQGNRLLLTYYRKLQRAVQSLLGAKDFKGLRTAFNLFIASFIDTQSLKGVNVKVIQYIRDTLSDLEELEIQLKTEKHYNPYDLFLTLLEERLYVEKKKEAGIVVYPYKVAGGIFPAFHFIVNAGHQATMVRAIRFPFLREDQKKRIAGEDTDLSTDFLTLYSVSGEQICYSCSRQGINGPELVPGLFVINGLIKDLPYEAELFQDAYTEELRAWRGEKIVPQRLYGKQVEGFRHIFSTAFIPKQGDFSRDPAGAAERQIILANLGGFTLLSPSALENFWRCPFGYLLQYGLGLEERAYDMVYQDPLLLGRIIHQFLKILFEQISAQDRFFREEHLSLYQKMLERLWEEYLAALEQSEVLPLPPVWEREKGSLISNLAAFLEQEGERFPHFHTFGLEQEFRISKEEWEITLLGRVDRITEKEGGLVIVDYKKRVWIKKGDILGHGEDPAGTPSSFQIPFYIYLLEQENHAVRGACYYDLEKQRYVDVYNPENPRALIHPQQKEQVLITTVRHMEEMVRRVRGGDFRMRGLDPAVRLRPDCEGCAFKRICRDNYTLE